MKFYKKDYSEIVDKSDDKHLYACSIVLINGEELFSYAKEIDGGIFFLQDPLKFIRAIDPQTGSPTFMFKRFNLFTDDTTMLMKESSIISICYLADVYIDIYRDAIKAVDKKMKSATQQVLKETEEDYWKQFDNVKKPTLLN